MFAFFADIVTTIHLAVVIYMILGLVLILVGGCLKWRWVRNPWFRLCHLAIMAYIVVNALLGKLCFLTHIERHFRHKAGQAMSGDRDEYSFVGRLLHDILFVDIPLHHLNKIYVLFGALVLASILFVPPSRRRLPT